MVTPEPEVAIAPLITLERADELVLEIDAELAKGGETAAALRIVTEIVVPDLGDWACLGYESSDGEDRYVIATPADKSKIKVAARAEAVLVKSLPAKLSSELAAGKSLLIPDMHKATAPVVAHNSEATKVYNEVRPRSTIAVPMAVRGEAPGVLLVAMAESGRQFTNFDLPIVERIARRLRPFLEGAMLHSQVERVRTSRDISAGLLDAVISESPVGLAFLDNSMQFNRVNETFANLVGATSDTNWSRSLNEMDSELAEQIMPAIQKILFDESPPVEIELSLRNPQAPSGSNHVVAHIYGVRGRGGSLEGAGIALLDVTARVEAEAARARIDSQLRIALDTARMGLFRWDTTNDRMQWSATTAVLLGLDPLAKPSFTEMLRVIHADDREPVRHALDAAVRSNGSCEIEYRVVDDDGSTRWMLLKAQTRSENDVVETIGVQMDVTEQRMKTDEQAKLARLQAQAGEQAVRMQRVSAALSRALTSTQVCDVLTTDGSAALGAPRSAVYLLDESGDAMQIACVHDVADRTESHMVIESFSRDDELPINDVVNTGEPLVVSDVSTLAERYPRLVEYAGHHGMQSCAVVRLESSGHVYGTWSLSWMQTREFNDGELMILLTLAVQGGKALERAGLFERERLISTALQRTLLPAELPTLVGASVARRYVPGATDIEVGGDWYDVIPLSPSRVALVIGDVSGHNVDSAAVMGQIRNAVRSYAWEGHQAGGVAEATNRLLCGLEPGVLATCCFVELNLQDGIASVALAGHPPPLIRRVDGGSELMEIPADPPLGTDPQQRFAQSSLFLSPGDTLVLYTDGLVETRDISLGSGLTYLARAAASAGEVTPDELANFLLTELANNDREDDITLLALRYEPESYAGTGSQRVVKRQLASTPASAGIARRFANDVLTDWGVIELADQVSLCVSELVTNALIHTATDVELVLRLSTSAVRVEVVDQSDRLPIVRDRSQDGDTTGRGLTIVEAMADSWGIDTTNGGKSVWFQLAR